MRALPFCCASTAASFSKTAPYLVVLLPKVNCNGPNHAQMMSDIYFGKGKALPLAVIWLPVYCLSLSLHRLSLSFQKASPPRSSTSRSKRPATGRPTTSTPARTASVRTPAVCWEHGHHFMRCVLVFQQTHRKLRVLVQSPRRHARNSSGRSRRKLARMCEQPQKTRDLP